MFERYVTFKISDKQLDRLLEKMPIEYYVPRSFYQTYETSAKNLAGRDRYSFGYVHPCFDWVLFLMYQDQEEYDFEFDMTVEEYRNINSWEQFRDECWGSFYEDYRTYLAFLVFKARELGLCQFSDEALQCGFKVYDV